MKKILVTGASGFFGKSVLRALHRRKTDDQFICLGHTHTLLPLDHRFVWERADLLDAEASARLMEKYKPSHVIHLAWYVAHGCFWHAPENVDWLKATNDLFDAFCAQGGQHFLGAGTLFEYDLLADPLDESAPISPQTLYGEAKAATYRLLLQKQKRLASRLALQWLRIGYFFGEEEPPQKFLSLMVAKMVRQEDIHAVSRTSLRDYGHVDILGEAISHLVDRPEDMVLNVSGGGHQTLGEIIDSVAQQLAYKRPILYGAYTPPAHEPENIQPNLSKLRALLGEMPGQQDFQTRLSLFVQHKTNEITQGKSCERGQA
ncbi:NAD-dependent epimerase/dehydratase family protein [Candidatus Hepatobacter penaei]|uniref:NAD-dependent epimerase/dehydratase family protein n=1 Tax=Candidatus Hepatobacter penaei TaxID=1274402 RepID=UPI0006981555|nr:NAD(P)-dependent oxidoreductase [Candidatus Hepatobacter penaei]